MNKNPHGFLLSFAKLNTIYIGVKLSISKTGLNLPPGRFFIRRRWTFAINGSPIHDEIGDSSNKERGICAGLFYTQTYILFNI